MRDDGLRRILEGLPRETAPPIDVDSLIRRLLWRRLRIAGALLALGLGSVAGLLALGQEPPPPVHLDLHLVDADGEAGPPQQGPSELNLP